MKHKYYWHFLPANGNLQFEPFDTVKVKHTLMLPPSIQIIPCKVGFHASIRAIDALQYAPGPIICRVTLHGNILPHGDPIDKYVAQGRTVLAMADGTDTLRSFARWSALQMIHLCNAPQVVIDYLNTGDESIRSAAWDAAWDAARAAARDAARDAARAAAGSAARDAARAAAWAAAGSAARSTAWAAAGSAARSAAGDVQNTKLEAMFYELLKLEELKT
jgi:hypothetical protein